MTSSLGTLFRRLAIAGCVAASFVAGSAERASAQVAASISGTVQDSSNAPLPGSTVTVTSLESAIVRTAVTDGEGRYHVLSLGVGAYTVKAAMDGFTTEVRSGISLAVGQEAVVNFTLRIGERREEVVVTGDAPLVNVTTNQTSGLVGEREVKDLPLNGRSFDALITLNAGTLNFSGQTAQGGLSGPGNRFAVAGRRPTENLFLLNGIEYAGASRSSAVTPGGASGQLLGIDAVREFNVVKDTYSAEYGKVAGGQVSIVTMSGSNSLHGTAFEFLRDSMFDARNFFDEGPPPPFRRNNFGGSAGGPIKKSRTFVFANYEGFRQRLGLSSVATVPDENARRGLLPDPNHPGQLINVGVAPGVAPYFAFWPSPTGRNFGDGTAQAPNSAKQTIHEDFLTGRLDHKLTDRDSLAAAYTFDIGDSTTPSTTGTITAISNNRAHVFSLEHGHIFSASLLNTLRLGISGAHYSYDAAPSMDLPGSLSFVAGRPVGAIVIGGGTAGGGALSNTGGGVSNVTTNVYATRTLYTLDDQLQAVRGRHLLKAGVWTQWLRDDELPTPSQYGQFTFSSLTTFLQGRASTFQVVQNPTEMHYRQFAGAWFAQDAITLRPNLTLSLGLRHEFTNGWNEADNRSSNFIQDGNGVLLSDPIVGRSPLTTNNAKWLFGPRVEVAWDPSGHGTTAIHSGVGVHYNLQNNLGFYVDPNPPFSTRYQLSNLTFPMQITTDSALPAAVAAPQGVQPDLKTPTVVGWGLSIDRQLRSKMALRVAYVGSHGYHFVTNTEVNGPIPTVLPDGTTFFPAGAPRANPKLGGSRIALSTSTSDYHALEISLARRLANGFQVRSNYTFGHSEDISSQIISGDANNSNQDLLDWRNPSRDRGPSSFDVRHRFSLSGSYELPLGPGHKWASRKTAAALFGAWQVNAILNMQSGFPFSPLLGFNQSRNGDTRAPDRPSLAAGVNESDIILGTPERWFDPTAFVLPLAGTFGNVGRNSLRGPGMATVDLSLFKNVSLLGGSRLQLRAEAFNLLNRANFGIPSVQVLNPDGSVRGAAGVISTTSTSSRQLQFGLKVIW